MRTALRRLGFGLATVLGIAPRGFFIPYRYSASAEPAAYPALEVVFAAADPDISGVIEAIKAFAPDIRRIADGPGPARFDQDWFTGLDATAAYALVRREKPRRIVEIGSGHSTRFLAAACADAGLETEILCIDPAPRAPLSALPVRHIARLFGPADMVEIAALAAGDMLFVDSSHVAMPGSDVDRLFLDVLPRLAPGVLVHVHDVFLPDAYPADWAWRGYNEQIVVGALLQGGAFAIVFASHWARTRRPERVARALPENLMIPASARESSLWMRKS